MIDRPDVRLFRPIKGGLLFVFCLLAVFPGFGKQQGRGTDYMLAVSVDVYKRQLPTAATSPANCRYTVRPG